MIAPWRAPCGRGSAPHSGGPPERRATTMTTHTNVTLGATSAGSRTRTVLVADESDQVRAVITDNLTADGYCVRRADSRAGALAILTEDRIDAVVVDVNGDTLG